MSRDRWAPNATRTDISRRRAVARARSIPATFALAIRSTSPAMTSSSDRNPSTGPWMSAGRPDIVVRRTPPNRRKSAGSVTPAAFRVSATRSLRACSTGTPARRRPNISSHPASSRDSSACPGRTASCIIIGTQTSALSGATDPWKPRAATPITVNGCPSTPIVRPTIVESPPNRRCQNPWLITTTGRALGVWSSSGAKNRPSAGRTPSTVK